MPSFIPASIEFLKGHLPLLIQCGIALAIFLLFLILRKLITKAIVAVLEKISKRKESDKPDIGGVLFIGGLIRPLRAFFIVLGIYLALQVLPLSAGITAFTAKMFRACVVALVAWAAVGSFDATALFFKGVESRMDMEVGKTLKVFIRKIFKALILIFAFVIIVGELGFNIGGLLTGIGLGGLTFALAAQDAASNIFGGFVILFDKPFAVDDWIETPTVSGVVEDITFRSTRIRTFTNSQIIVPNSKLSNEPITNWARMEKKRMRFTIGLSYHTPPDKIERCVARIRQMLVDTGAFYEDTIIVYFDEFLDSSLQLLIQGFTLTTEFQPFMEVRQQVNLSILKILEEEDAELAFPSRTVYLAGKEQL